MAYIGVQPKAGQYRKLDDISAGFNGVTTTFTTAVNNVSVTAGAATQLLVSLGGVIQQPNVDYTVSTNSVTFTTAPTAGLSFFAILMGDAINVGTPADGSVTTVKLVDSSVTTAKLADNSVTTAKLNSAGIAPIVTSINGGPLAGSRNRIINGDMRIDQRNAGASVNTDQAFPVDRFQQAFGGGGVITGQRSTTAPSGFTNSLLLTVSTADASIASTDAYNLQHKVEGFNVADFGSGTASATSFILSFWVRSSITGTYAGAVNNSAANRSYPFTYTINAANTFEFKSIAITADTTGTWLSDNGIGFRILWDLGSGSSFNGTAGAWTGSNVFRTSGSVNWIATNGATFYITGVQLEPGTVATPFERRSYGQELALCQRYFSQSRVYGMGYAPGAGQLRVGVSFLPIVMRTTPTISFTSATGSNVSGQNVERATEKMFGVFTNALAAGNFYIDLDYTASAEL